jgi:hypothetical protein
MSYSSFAFIGGVDVLWEGFLPEAFFARKQIQHDRS